MARINGFLTVNGSVTAQSLVVNGPAEFNFAAVSRLDPTADIHIVNKKYADTKLSLVGGTLTGPLSLSAAPTQALHAATKQYVDNLVLNTGGGYRVEQSFIETPGIETLRYPTPSSSTPVAAGMIGGINTRVSKTGDIITILEETYIPIRSVPVNSVQQFNIPLNKGRKFRLIPESNDKDISFNFINCGDPDNLVLYPRPIEAIGATAAAILDVEIIIDGFAGIERFLGWCAFRGEDFISAETVLDNFVNYEFSQDNNKIKFKFLISFDSSQAIGVNVILDDIVEYGTGNRASGYQQALLPIPSIASDGAGLQYPRSSMIPTVSRLSRDRRAVIRNFTGIALTNNPGDSTIYLNTSYSGSVNYLIPTGNGLNIRIPSYTDAINLTTPDSIVFFRPKAGDPIVLINPTIFPITIVPPSDGSVISDGLPLTITQNQIVTLHKVPSTLPRNNVWIYSNDKQYVQANSVSPTGATFTGPVVLASDPVSPLQAATKNYVDTMAMTGYELRATFTNFGDPIIAADANTVYLTATATGQISLVTILGDGGPSGCSIDILKSPLSGFPLVSTDSIVNLNYPEIVADSKVSVTNFTGWSTINVTKDEIIGIKLRTNGIFTNIFVNVRVSL